MGKIMLFQQSGKEHPLSEQAAEAAVKPWVQKTSQPGRGQGVSWRNNEDKKNVKLNECAPGLRTVIHLTESTENPRFNRNALQRQ